MAVSPAAPEVQPRIIGRYAIYDEIASGGMASVHYGRLHASAGFSRTVAIKRLHPMYARDPEFIAMFLTEARLAARIRHTNVVQTLDVVATDDEIFLVLEYVLGDSLANLRRAMIEKGRPADPRVVATIMGSVLRGLHAAHEARREDGAPLDIVHRDVSPQNILVGADGIARVIDFGVAKALGNAQTTRDGQVKGKIAYMAPEQLNGERVTRQCDVYAAAVVVWEMLTCQRLFSGEHPDALVRAVLGTPVRPPSDVAPHVSTEIDRVVLRGLDRAPADRYATAKEMALELESCAGVVSAAEVGEWVESLVGDELSRRAAQIARIEGGLGVARGSPRSADEPTVVGPGASSAAREGSPPAAQVAPPPPRPSPTPFAVGTPQSPVRRRFIYAASVASFAAAVALSLAWARHPGIHTLSPPSSPTGATGVPSASAATLAVDLKPEATARPTGAASAAESPIASSTPRGARPPPSAVRPATAPAQAPLREAPNPCNPPFTVGGKGHKHYKATCL